MKQYNQSLQFYNTQLQKILDTINTLPKNITLPTLNNPGTSEDLIIGKQLINENGTVIKGTFTLQDELSAQDNIIKQMAITANNLPDNNLTAAKGTAPFRVGTQDGGNMILYYYNGLEYVKEEWTSYTQSFLVDIQYPIFIYYFMDSPEETFGVYPEIQDMNNIKVLGEQSLGEISSICIIQCLAPDTAASCYLYQSRWV